MAKKPVINVEALLDLTLNEKSLSKDLSQTLSKAFKDVNASDLSKDILNVEALRKDAQVYQAEMQRVVKNLNSSQGKWTTEGVETPFEALREKASGDYKGYRKELGRLYAQADKGDRRELWKELKSAESMFGGRKGFQQVLAGGIGNLYTQYGAQVRDAQKATQALGKMVKMPEIPKENQQFLQRMVEAPKEAAAAYDAMSKVQQKGARDSIATYKTQVKVLKDVGKTFHDIRELETASKLNAQLEGSKGVLSSFDNVTNVAKRHQQRQTQQEKDRIAVAKQTVRERIKSDPAPQLMNSGWLQSQLDELGVGEGALTNRELGDLKGAITRSKKIKRSGDSSEFKAGIEHLLKLDDVGGAENLLKRGKGALDQKHQADLARKVELAYHKFDKKYASDDAAMALKSISNDVKNGDLKSAALRYKHNKDRFDDKQRQGAEISLENAGKARVEDRRKDEVARISRDIGQQIKGIADPSAQHFDFVSKALEKTGRSQSFKEEDTRKLQDQLDAVIQRSTASKETDQASAARLRQFNELSRQIVDGKHSPKSLDESLLNESFSATDNERLRQKLIEQSRKQSGGKSPDLRAREMELSGYYNDLITRGKITSADELQPYLDRDERSAYNGTGVSLPADKQQSLKNTIRKNLTKQELSSDKKQIAAQISGFTSQMSRDITEYSLGVDEVQKRINESGLKLDELETQKLIDKSKDGEARRQKAIVDADKQIKRDNSYAKYKDMADPEKTKDRLSRSEYERMVNADLALSNKDRASLLEEHRKGSEAWLTHNQKTRKRQADDLKKDQEQQKAQEKRRQDTFDSRMRAEQDRRRQLKESGNEAHYQQFLREGAGNMSPEQRDGARQYMQGMSGVLEREYKATQARFSTDQPGMVNRASTELNNLQRQMTSFRAATAQANPQVAAFNRYMTNFLKFGIGYQVLGNLTRGVMELGRSIAGLDEQMYAIRAISGSTEREVDRLSGTILKVAQSTKFSVSEIAASAQVLAQAGVPIADMDKTLSAVANFAAATSSSLETSAGLLSTMREVFDDMDEMVVADQLTRVINISRTTADDLSTILSVSAQTAQQYQLSSEQYFAAVATLRNAGLKASTVGTGLRQAVTEVFNPSTKAVNVLIERYQALGEEMDATAVSARFYGFQQAENPLVAAISELRRLGYGGEADMQFQGIYNIRAMNALSALNANMEDLAFNESRITFGRASAEAAQIQLESLNATVDNFGAALTAMGANVLSGPVRALQQMTRSATEAVQALTELDIEFKTSGGGGLSDMGGAGVFGAIGGAMSGATWKGRLTRGALGGVSGVAASYAAQTDDAVKAGTASLISISTGIMSIFGSVSGAAALLGKSAAGAKVVAGVSAFAPKIGIIIAAATAIGGVLSHLSKGSYVDQLRNQAEAAAQIAQKSEAEAEELQQAINEFGISQDAPGTGTTGHRLNQLAESSRLLDLSIANHLGEITGDTEAFLAELARYSQLGIAERKAAQERLAAQLANPEALNELETPDAVLTSLSVNRNLLQGGLDGAVDGFGEFIDTAVDTLRILRRNGQGDSYQAQYYGSLLDQYSKDPTLQGIRQGTSDLDVGEQFQHLQGFLNHWAQGLGALEELQAKQLNDDIESALADYKQNLAESDNGAMVQHSVEQLASRLQELGVDAQDYIDRIAESSDQVKHIVRKGMPKGHLDPFGYGVSESERFLLGQDSSQLANRVGEVAQEKEVSHDTDLAILQERFSGSYDTVLKAISDPESAEGNQFAAQPLENQTALRELMKVPAESISGDITEQGVNSRYVAESEDGLELSGAAETIADAAETFRAGARREEEEGDDPLGKYAYLEANNRRELQVQNLNLEITEAQNERDFREALKLLGDRQKIEQEGRDDNIGRLHDKRSQAFSAWNKDPNDAEKGEAYSKAQLEYLKLESKHNQESFGAGQEREKFQKAIDDDDTRKQIRSHKAAEDEAKASVKALTKALEDALKEADINIEKVVQLSDDIEEQENIAINEKYNQRRLRDPEEKKTLDAAEAEEKDAVRGKLNISDVISRSNQSAKDSAGIEDVETWNPRKEQFGETPTERKESLEKDLDHQEKFQDKLYELKLSGDLNLEELREVNNALKESKNTVAQLNYQMETLPQVPELPQWESIGQGPAVIAKEIADAINIIDWSSVGEGITAITQQTDTLGRSIENHLVKSVVDLRDALKDAIWESNSLGDALKAVGLSLTRNIFDSAFDSFTDSFVHTVSEAFSSGKGEDGEDSPSMASQMKSGAGQIYDKGKNLLGFGSGDGETEVHEDPVDIVHEGTSRTLLEAQAGETPEQEIADKLTDEVADSEGLEDIGDTVKEGLEEGFSGLPDLLGGLFSGIGGMFSGGFGGMLGGLFSDPAKLATGGIISGGGTTTSDSIPGVIKGANGKAVRGIMLSNKESVLNAKATAALGEDFVHAANLGMVSKASLGNMVNAAGYTIKNDFNAPTQNVNVNAPDVSVQEGDTKIVNVLDSQLLDGYIQSREGEKSIVNVMQRYDVI